MADILELFPDYAETAGGDLSGLSFRNGNPDAPERHALARVARLVGARTVFEFGTFQGGTALMLARLPGIEAVYTLDLPEGTEPALFMADTDRDYLHAAALELPATVVRLWGDSAVFDFAPYTGQCELVYVDGAHSAEYMARDLANALSLVKDGGAVVWHAGAGAGVEHLPPGLEFYPLSERMGVVRGNLPKLKTRKAKKAERDDRP